MKRTLAANRPIAVWLLVMVICLTLIARAHFSADLSAFLPASPHPQQRLLVEQLQNGAAGRTLMIGIEGGDSRQRTDASRALARALRAHSAFEQVQNGERADWEAAAALIVAHRYQLSPAMNAEHFSVAGLRDAIADTLSLLGTPQGSLSRLLLTHDPSGEVQRITEGLTPAHAPRMENGVWVSRTAPRAVLLLVTRAAGADLDAQAAAIAAVRQVFTQYAARDLRLELSGPAAFAVQSRALIEHEASLLGSLGLLAIGGLLLAAFSSPRALATALLPVATGIAAGIATTSVVFGNVHGLTLAFGCTLIGETVDYAIYFLIQAHEGGWQRWRAQNWPTVRLGLLTSVCGFATLIFSGFPGLAQLGVFSVAGLVAAALATRFVLPTLMPNGAAGNAVRQRLAHVASRALVVLPRARLSLIVLGALSFSALLLQGSQLWRGDLSSLNPVPRKAQAADAMLRSDLGANDARTLVVVTATHQQEALRTAESVAETLDTLVQQGVLAGYDSPTRLLPSQAMQQRRTSAIPEPATLQNRLAQATANSPLSAERLRAFLQDAERARTASPLTSGALTGTPLQPVLEALLFQRHGGGWCALLLLQAGPNGIDAAQVSAALTSIAAPGEVQVLDIKQSLDDLYASYLRQALLQAIVGGCAVLTLIAWRLRSIARVAAVAGPLALAVTLTMGSLAACGVGLGILHLVGLLLVVAVGSNYGLFFDQWRTAGERPSRDTLASLLLANLTTVIAFGLLALSDIPALSDIGRVVTPGTLLTLIAAAAFAGNRQAVPAHRH